MLALFQIDSLTRPTGHLDSRVIGVASTRYAGLLADNLSVGGEAKRLLTSCIPYNKKL